MDERNKIKVLIVCSGTEGILSPFIKDQMDSLKKLGVEFSLFQINRKGVFGYLSHLNTLNKYIKKTNPDLIHAHYGLSGLLANLQRKTPVITTYHGSDINKTIYLYFSKIAIRLSRHNIFVSYQLSSKAKVKKKYSIIPCGVDLGVFKIDDKTKSRKKLNMNLGEKFILFSSDFSNKVKNYPLAVNTIQLLISMGVNIKLAEFKGYNREEANTLMNAANCVLLTSLSEGSPLVIKEAMACNCPIISTDVGDVKWVLGETEGCYLSTYNVNDVAEKAKLALEFSEKNGKTNGRARIIELGLDSETIAGKIIEVYSNVLKTA